MKKILVILAAITLVLCVIGCGGSDSETTGSGGQAPADTAASNTDDSQAAADSGSSGGEDPYPVFMILPDTATAEAVKAVEEEASKITIPKFNASIEMLKLGFAEWSDQMNLMLAAGEKIDLLMASWYDANEVESNGQMLPMRALLEQYGQDMLNDISDAEWACSMSSTGEIYGVRNNKELACGYGIAMLTEVMDTLDFDFSSIKSEADLTELFREVKEKHPDMYPVVSDAGSFGNYLSTAVDWLGTNFTFGALENALDRDTTTVVNWWTSDTYKGICDIRHQWVKEGLMMPDPTTNSETATNLMAAGKAFSTFTDVKPGIKSQMERWVAKDVTVIGVVPTFSVTNNLNNKWHIPYTSEQPDKAMQVLNEMYTNAELANILIYGVEGLHIKVVDEALGLVDYADGIDASNSPYSIHSWAFPNQLIAYKWHADGPDIWEETLVFNAEAIQSVAKGFTWNSSPVENEIAACSAVLEKYRNGLDTGELDPDVIFPQAKAEFEAAGVQKIIDEKQRQLDEWLANR